MNAATKIILSLPSSLVSLEWGIQKKRHSQATVCSKRTEMSQSRTPYQVFVCMYVWTVYARSNSRYMFFDESMFLELFATVACPISGTQRPWWFFVPWCGPWPEVRFPGRTSRVFDWCPGDLLNLEDISELTFQVVNKFSAWKSPCSTTTYYHISKRSI